MITRRSFLSLMGTAVAVSALPSWADDPVAFSKRGKFERLSLAYQHIHIGLEKPFSVLHLSDTHLTAAYPHEHADKQKLKKIRTQTFGGRQEEALRDSLAWARENVDYVIHTGDLIDWQSEANFDLVKKYLGPNVIGAVGNHEYSRSMWLEKPLNTPAYKAETCALVESAYPFNIHFQSKVINGVNFVSFDSVRAAVTPEHVERFHAEVKKGFPIILCMHIPFITPHLWRAHCKFWRFGKRFTSSVVPDATGAYTVQQTDPTTKEFIAYLKSLPLLKGILAGHFHITVQDRFSVTAKEFVVGGNFMFHGQEVMFT